MTTTPTTIRIGIETRLLAGNRAGIGNYCFNLLRALTGQFPELDYDGFDGLSWRPFAAELRRLEAATAAAPAVGPSVSAPGARLRHHLGKSETLRVAYRALKGAAFTRSVRRQSLDLFHALYFIPPADIGMPMLPVIYDLSSVRFPDTHPPERRRWLDRVPAVIAKAPLVQTISQFTRNEIVSVYRYPPERIIIAPPAAASIFRPLGADQTERDLKAFDLTTGSYLLAVGTLEPRKNLKTLIIAYAQLSKHERQRTPLVIAGGSGWGDIGLPGETAALVQDGSLRFVGAVSDAQLRSLYEGAIALMFPSIYEGFGMPVVEAMSCGTPVVHSQDTSMDEITDGLALRLAALDIDGWSAAIRGAVADGRLTDGGERAALMKRARAFAWTISAERVRDAYSALLR